jgi:hypothetical protein
MLGFSAPAVKAINKRSEGKVKCRGFMKGVDCVQVYSGIANHSNTPLGPLYSLRKTLVVEGYGL